MTQCTTRNSKEQQDLKIYSLFWTLLEIQSQVPTLHPICQPQQTCHHNPNPHTLKLLDETPDESLGTTNHEAGAFAKAINKIVKANYGPPNPSRSFGNPIHSMVLTPGNFAPSSFSATELQRSS